MRPAPAIILKGMKVLSIRKCVNDPPEILPKRWQYVTVSRGGRINEDTGLPPASDVDGVVCSKHAKELRSLLKKKNNNNVIKLPYEKEE